MIPKNVETRETEETNPNPMGNVRWITGFFAGLAITALTYFYSSVLYPEFNDVHNDWVFVVAAICLPLSLITGIIGWVLVAWLLKKREVGERAMYILTAFFLIVAVLLFWGISTWDNYLFY